MIAADTMLVVNDPDEFGGRIPVGTRVAAIHCTTGILYVPPDTGEVNNITHLAVCVLRDGAENGIKEGSAIGL